MIRPPKKYKYNLNYNSIIEEAVKNVESKHIGVPQNIVLFRKYNQNTSILSNINRAKDGKSLRTTPSKEEKVKQKMRTLINTPKQKLFETDSISLEDVDQLSQIKFISKEYSTIKDNINSDNLIFYNDTDNLEEFSPLFEKEQRNSQNNLGQLIKFVDKNTTSARQNTRQACKQIKNGFERKKSIGSIVRNTSRIKDDKNDRLTDIFSICNNSDAKRNAVLSKQTSSTHILTSQLNYRKKEESIRQVDESCISFKNFIFKEEKNKEKQTSNRIQKLSEKLTNFMLSNNISNQPQKLIRANHLNRFQRSIVKIEQPEEFRSFPEIQQIQKRAEKYRQLLKNDKFQQRETKNNEKEESVTSIQNDSEVIKGILGSQFELSFEVLKKHI